MQARIKVFAVALAVLALTRMALMWGTRVFEPSEARYAAISANMARTGDWLAPSFTYMGEYEIFSGKPPLAFQMSAICAKILGVNEFSVRLVPFLSFMALLAILYYAARRAHPRNAPHAACLAVAICATMVAPFATAGFCMTDMPLTACTAGAILLYAVDEGKTLSSACAIGCLLAFGMLIKGPVSPALFAISVGFHALLNRRLPRPGWTNFLSATAIFLAIAVPYFLAVERRQPGFLEYFFVNENFKRFLFHDYGDKYGAGRETFRGMAAVWALVTTLPWSLIPVAFARRVKAKLALRSFGTCAIMAMTVFWCLTSRVPLTYLLPVAPLFAFELAKHPEMFGAKPETLWRLVPFAVAIAVIVLTATLTGWRIINPKKMPGPAAPQKISDHYFSHEFYHGAWGKGAPAL